jgi:hypothetical protein
MIMIDSICLRINMFFFKLSFWIYLKAKSYFYWSLRWLLDSWSWLIHVGANLTQLNLKRELSKELGWEILIFLIYFFSRFYPLILNWLENRFHDLFWYVFCRVIIILKQYSNIVLVLDFEIIFFYHIIKINNFKEQSY